MPLRLNVGVSKKMGLPDYGSLGTSCHVEVEVDGYPIFDDLEAFHHKVRQAYVACAQAVNDELVRQTDPDSQTARLTASQNVSQTVRQTSRQAGSQTPSVSPTGAATTNGNGHRHGVNGTRASQKQLDYATQLAGQIQGLGAHRLEALAIEMFDKSLAGLSSTDASALIDTLKAIKEGRLELTVPFTGDTI